MAASFITAIARAPACCWTAGRLTRVRHLLCLMQKPDSRACLALPVGGRAFWVPTPQGAAHE